MSETIRIGLEATDGVDYRDYEGERGRILVVDGRTCEHVAEDADGVWIYRVVAA